MAQQQQQKDLLLVLWQKRTVCQVFSGLAGTISFYIAIKARALGAYHI